MQCWHRLRSMLVEPVAMAVAGWVLHCCQLGPRAALHFGWAFQLVLKHQALLVLHRRERLTNEERAQYRQRAAEEKRAAKAALAEVSRSTARLARQWACACEVHVCRRLAMFEQDAQPFAHCSASGHPPLPSCRRSRATPSSRRSVIRCR